MNEKENDSNFQNKVISKTLDKANVKIKDKAFANILSQFASNKNNTNNALTSSVGK